MKMDLQNIDLERDYVGQSGSVLRYSTFSQVLVILDAKEDKASVHKALSHHCDDVDIIASTETAYTQFYSTLYDLVICDLSILGSLEFLENISSIRSSLPVIAIVESSQLGEAVLKIPTSDLAWVIKDSGNLEIQLSAATALVAKRSTKHTTDIDIHTERNAYWAATNCAPEGVAILGEDGTVVFANERFNRFLKPLEFGAECSNVIELLGSNNSLVAEALLIQLSSAPAGSVWQSEIQIQETDAKESLMFFEITLSVTDISSTSGAIGSYLAESNLRRRVLWIKDITAQKQQEQFLRDLVSTTSHDLKGPLGAISNAAEMLTELEDPDPETFKVLINAIYSCSRKSIDVIDELLKCPSIKESALRLNKISVPLEELINDVVGDFGPTAMTKEIKVRVNSANTELALNVDRVAIYRVFGNLVSNALKFSRPGGSIEITVKNESPTFVVISFKDSGPGIEAREMSQLFQRFGRLSRTQSVEGTGLGLFAVKSIVDAHNGRIEVESELGVSSTFTVFLPKD